jgi:hypothetical protein
MPELTRRNVMIGVTALSATAAVGGATLLAIADVEAELVAYIRKTLPGVHIEEASVLQCVKDFMVWRQWSSTKKLIAGAAWSVAGVDAMATIDQNFEVAARRAVTLFMTNSNFFDLDDPRSGIVVYEKLGEGAACINPFANLDPPQSA